MASLPHETKIRVRYEETDRMGVAYYGKYFTWFEVARTEFFRSTGLSYREIEEKNGLSLMVVSARCEYKSPVTYDDLLTVETTLTSMRNTSIVFGYAIKCGSSSIASGETSHVFTNKNGRPVKIPEDITSALLPDKP